MWLKNLFSAKPGPGVAGAPTTAVDDSVACKKQGDACVQQEQLDQAVAHYQRALAINPGYLEACIGMGFALTEQEQYAQAQAYLQRALAIDPNVADVHYLLGRVAKCVGDPARAIEHYGRAIAIDPALVFAHRDRLQTLIAQGQNPQAQEAAALAVATFPDSAEFLFYQGNLLSQDARFEPAIACYRKVLSLQPQALEACLPLAEVLVKVGQLEEAIGYYRDAARHQPEHAPTQLGLGVALEKQGNRVDAIACYRSAVALEPANGLAHYYLGNALLAQGAAQEARLCFEEVVRLDPGNSVAHLVAALSGHSTDCAPSGYVERLFDEYADKFDSHLVKVLHYGVPQKLAAALLAHRVPDGQPWDILDLGCGTGLFGAAIAPVARHLVGVDLSAKMLEKARTLQVYHRLEHAELVEMMQREAASQYDVVSATDVLVYIGKLEALAEQVRRVLHPGGLFAFSVESLDARAQSAGLTEPRDFHLNTTGRYAHSLQYLERIASDNGFDILSSTQTQSRMEKRCAVEGYLMIWARRADPL